MIKAIETHYKGYRFRSRAEARWAIFFEAAGIAFDYEPQGVIVDGQAYLPDFWLPHGKFWFEVKGTDPTDRERDLCARLSIESGNACILAVGPPSRDNHVILFHPHPDNWLGKGDVKFRFCGLDGGAALEECDGGNYVRIVSECRSIKGAYEAAASARFEHGESGPEIKKLTYADLHRRDRSGWRR